GNVIPTVRIIWSSNNVAVARVDNNGTVTGVGGGVPIVEARAGTRKGQAAVQVVGAAAAPPQTPPGSPPAGGQAQPPATGVDPFAGQVVGSGPAAVLRIEPPTVYLLPSENTRVLPRALREDGSPAAPVTVTWKSLRPDIASVDQNGVVVALAPGQGTVQVTGSSGLTATAPVVVQPSDIAIQEPIPLVMSPGDVDTLHVVVLAQGGRLVSPLALPWCAAAPGVVFTWQIRVIAARLKLTAARLGLPLNRRYPLKANFADEAGVIIGPATGVTWTSDNPQVVAVAEDGTVSTASYGHAHITAT